MSSVTLFLLTAIVVVGVVGYIATRPSNKH